MSRTYSSCRPSHFFSRYVIGSKITRRIVQVSLPKICRFLTLFSSFTCSLFLSRSLSFSLMPFIHSHIYRDRPHSVIFWDRCIQLWYIYTLLIHLYTGWIFSRIHDSSFSSHPFIRWRGRGCIFRVRLQSVLFYHHFTESVSSGSAMRADVCDLRKIYFFPYIFQHYMHLTRYVYR